MKHKLAWFKKHNRLPDWEVPVTTKVDPTIDTSGFFVVQKHLTARKNAKGTYHGYVPGGGGDLWWVKHEDGTVGAYVFTEVN